MINARVSSSFLGVCLCCACGGQVDPASLGSGQAGQSAGDAAAASSGGSSGGVKKPGSGCAIASPVHESFESTFPPAGWGAANPIGIKLDSSAPIAGAQSLHVTVAGFPRSYANFTLPTPSTCGATITLKLRVDAFFASGDITVLRVGAQPTFFDVVVDSEGEVSMVEENDGKRHFEAMGKLTPKIAATVSATIDLRTNTLTRSLSIAGQPPAEPGSSPVVSTAGAVQSISLGMFNSTAASGSSVWLDDFALE